LHMDFKSVNEKYRGLWVAAHVLRRDEASQPADLDVIAFSHDRISVREKVLNEKEICVFYAGEIPPGGYLMLL